MAQICMDYNSLPDVFEMDVDEIAFFYLKRIKELCKIQQDAEKG